jgi:hypothetical protein
MTPFNTLLKVSRFTIVNGNATDYLKESNKCYIGESYTYLSAPNLSVKFRDTAVILSEVIHLVKYFNIPIKFKINTDDRTLTETDFI